MCYVVCHIFHDMYTQEEKPVIDCVFESKEDASTFVASANANGYNYYYMEEAEFFHHN